MRLDIRYRTTFIYDDFVSESQNELRACPISDEHQELVRYRVTVAPATKVASYVDYWGTRVDTFGHRSPHVGLEVLAEATVDTKPRPQPTGFSRPEGLGTPAFLDQHSEFLERTPHCDWGSAVADLAAEQVRLAGPDVVSRVLALHRLVGTSVEYRKGITEVGEPVDMVLAHGYGVCQDFAHLAVSFCRSQGIPARYVSGYLFTRDETVLDETELEDDEPVRVQTHAWFEAAIPGWGWFGLDPTNQQAVGQRHVKIGHGRDYDDVKPLRGVFSGAAGAMVTPDVEIRRLVMAETAPPALPGRLLQQHQQQQ
jgi:transglutaminase-like putative cysteine protease